MKEKAIEKIPFLTLPKTSRKKNVWYIGVTAWRNIGGEQHLFLEVYRNEKSRKQIPVVRYVAAKKDWGVYLPEEQKWHRRGINTDGLVWRETGCGSGHRKSEENILYSPDDLERIKKFFRGSKVYDEKNWWEYFQKHEESIERTKWKRKQEKRERELKERTENTQDLPEKELLVWADNTVFQKKHYLYYRKKGRKAVLACSKCGGISYESWKQTETFEGQFERQIREPRKNHYMECPLCKALGICKPQGTAKTEYHERGYGFTADRYKENGVVIRYLQFDKEYILEEIPGADGKPEMHGAYEKLEGVELVRAYLEPGKKIKKDYHKNSYYTGDFWDDCNLYGLSSIRVREAAVYPALYKALDGTFLQYCALKEYAAEKKSVNVMDYLERYVQIPQIELLVKMQMYGVAEELIKGYCGIIEEKEAKSPAAFLGIRKERIKMLRESKGSVELLRVLKKEKRLGQQWTKEQIEGLCEIRKEAGDRIEGVLTVMTLQKALNRIQKYAGCRFGTACSTATSRLQAAATMYFDYLSMRQQLGYDLTNSVYQQPRNLQEAHLKMVTEQNEKEQDKRMKEAGERFPLIQKNYRKLRRRYFYEDETYQIRPARSAGEIVLEGRTLHHCVGGDNYLRKHNEEKSIILFLRFKKNPELPYITVEIEGEKIIQWYGAYDKKPDEKNMGKWLEDYVSRLKERQTEAVQKAADGAAGERLMAAAG